MSYALCDYAVGKRGLEPPRIAPQPPQGCVYTNFTTCPY